MQMLKNILGSNKGYYLELNESEQSKQAETVSKTADTVKQEAVAKPEPTQNAVATSTEAVQTTQDTVSKVVTEAKPTAKKPAKTTTEAKSQQNGKVAKTDAKPQPTKVSPKNSGASSFDPPFWVAAMYKNGGAAANENGSTDSEQTFATDNLMPTITKYRRRPGASLGKFKDMAKKAKTPKG